MAYGEAGIRAAQEAGDLPDDLEPLDLQALVVGMSLAWAPASLVHVAEPDDPGPRGAPRGAARRGAPDARAGRRRAGRSGQSEVMKPVVLGDSPGKTEAVEAPIRVVMTSLSTSR